MKQLAGNKACRHAGIQVGTGSLGQCGGPVIPESTFDEGDIAPSKSKLSVKTVDLILKDHGIDIHGVDGSLQGIKSRYRQATLGERLDAFVLLIVYRAPQKAVHRKI